MNIDSKLKFLMQVLICLGGFMSTASAGAASDNYYTIGEKTCGGMYVALMGPKSIDLQDPKDDDLVYKFYTRLKHRVGISHLHIVHPSIARDLKNVDPVNPNGIVSLKEDGGMARIPRPPKWFPTETMRVNAQMASTIFDLSDPDQTEFVAALPVKNFLGHYADPKHLSAGNYKLKNIVFRVQDGPRLLCELELPDGIKIKIINDL